MEKNFVNNQFTNIQQNNLNPQNQFQKGNMSVLNNQGFNMMYYDNMDASQNKLTNNNASMLKNFNPMININMNFGFVGNAMQSQIQNINNINNLQRNNMRNLQQNKFQ